MYNSNFARKLLNTNFVGRKYAFEQISNLWTVQPGAPRSMLLWGDWSVGKSEVLRNAEKHLEGIAVAYTNLQRLGCDREVKYVWEALALAVEEACDIVYIDDSFFESPYLSFVECLTHALERYPNQKLILAIDEYETFLDIPETAEIIEKLEELTLKHDRLAFLLCGSHHSDRVEIRFKPTRTLWLGAFTKEETLQFINQQPYKFDLEAADRLYELTRGQPWLVRGLCFNIIYEFNEIAEEDHEAPSSVSVFDVNEIADSDKFYENYNNYFGGLWHRAKLDCGGITLQEILVELADDTEGSTIYQIARYIGTRRLKNVTKVCRLAMERHSGSLIVKQWKNDVETYRVAIELFRRWIVRTQK